MTASNFHYQRVYDLLRQNIGEGRLPDGTVLLEGPIADLLDVSRITVKRALDLLCSEGSVRRFPGRGFLVGQQGAPNRVKLYTLDLDLGPQESAAPPRAAWQRIYDDVEQAVILCMPFGTYQISEAVIGRCFNVSRTVVRDVLNRINDRGLIEKDRMSHWLAGPLTARDIQEHFELRAILEPAALLRAAPLLARDSVIAMRNRVDALLQQGEAPAPEALEEVEKDLHERCLEAVKNRRLAAAMRQVHVPGIIGTLFASTIGTHDTLPALREHRAVYEELLAGKAQEASETLARHLEAERERTRARLKVLSVIPAQSVAPYLTRVY